MPNLKKEADLTKEAEQAGIQAPIVIRQPDGTHVVRFDGKFAKGNSAKDNNMMPYYLPKEYADEFLAYLNDRLPGNLTKKEKAKTIKQAALRSIHDMVRLLKAGYAHESLVPFSHNGVHWEWDYWRWETPVIFGWFRNGPSTLHKKKKSLSYPNLRMSGLADFEHVKKLEKFNETHKHFNHGKVHHDAYSLAIGQNLAEWAMTILEAAAANGLSSRQTADILLTGLKEHASNLLPSDALNFFETKSARRALLSTSQRFHLLKRVFPNSIWGWTLQPIMMWTLKPYVQSLRDHEVIGKTDHSHPTQTSFINGAFLFLFTNAFHVFAPFAVFIASIEPFLNQHQGHMLIASIIAVYIIGQPLFRGILYIARKLANIDHKRTINTIRSSVSRFFFGGSFPVVSKTLKSLQKAGFITLTQPLPSRERSKDGTALPSRERGKDKAQVMVFYETHDNPDATFKALKPHLRKGDILVLEFSEAQGKDIVQQVSDGKLRPGKAYEMLVNRAKNLGYRVVFKDHIKKTLKAIYKRKLRIETEPDVSDEIVDSNIASSEQHAQAIAHLQNRNLDSAIMAYEKHAELTAATHGERDKALYEKIEGLLEAQPQARIRIIRGSFHTQLYHNLHRLAKRANLAKPKRVFVNGTAIQSAQQQILIKRQIFNKPMKDPGMKRLSLSRALAAEMLFQLWNQESYYDEFLPISDKIASRLSQEEIENIVAEFPPDASEKLEPFAYVAQQLWREGKILPEETGYFKEGLFSHAIPKENTTKKSTESFFSDIFFGSNLPLVSKVLGKLSSITLTRPLPSRERRRIGDTAQLMFFYEAHGQYEKTLNALKPHLKDGDTLVLELPENYGKDILQDVSDGKLEPAKGAEEFEQVIDEAGYSITGKGSLEALLKAIYNRKFKIEMEPAWPKELVDTQAHSKDQFEEVFDNIMELEDLDTVLRVYESYLYSTAATLLTRDTMLAKKLRAILKKDPDTRIRIIRGAHHTPLYHEMTKFAKAQGLERPKRVFAIAYPIRSLISETMAKRSLFEKRIKDRTKRKLALSKALLEEILSELWNKNASDYDAITPVIADIVSRVSQEEIEDILINPPESAEDAPEPFTYILERMWEMGKLLPEERGHFKFHDHLIRAKLVNVGGSDLPFLDAKELDIPKVSWKHSLKQRHEAWQGEQALEAPLTSYEHWILWAITLIPVTASLLSLSIFLFFNIPAAVGFIIVIAGGTIGSKILQYYGLPHLREARYAYKVRRNAKLFNKKYPDLEVTPHPNPLPQGARENKILDDKLLGIVKEFTKKTGWEVIWTTLPHVLAKADTANRLIVLNIGWIVKSDEKGLRRERYLKDTLGKLEHAIHLREDVYGEGPDAQTTTPPSVIARSDSNEILQQAQDPEQSQGIISTAVETPEVTPPLEINSVWQPQSAFESLPGFQQVKSRRVPPGKKVAARLPNASRELFQHLAANAQAKHNPRLIQSVLRNLMRSRQHAAGSIQDEEGKDSSSVIASPVTSISNEENKARQSQAQDQPKNNTLRNIDTNWYQDSKDTIKLRMPTLFNILQSPRKVAVLMIALSFLRMIYPYDMANTSELPPIEYAKANNIGFKLGELRIVPVSESFRRHIIYVEDNQGTYAVELKIPGEDKDRHMIFEKHFDIAKEMWDTYPDNPGVVKPVYFGKFNGSVNMYGKNLEYNTERPLGVSIFEYEDGKRLTNAKSFISELAHGEWDGRYDKIRYAALADIAAASIRLHRLGWQGSTIQGKDMHMENARILKNGKGELVADFGAFKKLYPTMMQRINETSGLLGILYDPMGVGTQIYPQVVERLIGDAKNENETEELLREIREELLIPPSHTALSDPKLNALEKKIAQEAEIPAPDLVFVSEPEPAGKGIFEKKATGLISQMTSRWTKFSGSNISPLHRLLIILDAVDHQTFYKQAFKLSDPVATFEAWKNMILKDDATMLEKFEEFAKTYMLLDALDLIKIFRTENTPIKEVRLHLEMFYFRSLMQKIKDEGYAKDAKINIEAWFALSGGAFYVKALKTIALMPKTLEDFPNMNRIALAHEASHHLIDQLLPISPYGQYDRGIALLTEAWADYGAASQLNDPKIGGERGKLGGMDTFAKFSRITDEMTGNLPTYYTNGQSLRYLLWNLRKELGADRADEAFIKSIKDFNIGNDPYFTANNAPAHKRLILDYIATLETRLTDKEKEILTNLKQEIGIPHSGIARGKATQPKILREIEGQSQQSSPMVFPTGQKQANLKQAQGQEYDPYQMEPETAVYPGGIDLHILDAFPNVREIHILNLHPFRVETPDEHTTEIGRSIYQEMAQEDRSAGFIPTYLQEHLMYANGKAIIGLEPIMLADLEARDAQNITVTHLSENQLPTFRIDFTDKNNKERTIIYTQSNATKPTFSQELEKLIKEKNIGLILYKAYTDADLPEPLYKGLKNNGLIASDRIIELDSEGLNNRNVKELGPTPLMGHSQVYAFRISATNEAPELKRNSGKKFIWALLPISLFLASLFTPGISEAATTIDPINAQLSATDILPFIGSFLGLGFLTFPRKATIKATGSKSQIRYADVLWDELLERLHSQYTEISASQLQGLARLYEVLRRSSAIQGPQYDGTQRIVHNLEVARIALKVSTERQFPLHAALEFTAAGILHDLPQWSHWGSASKNIINRMRSNRKIKKALVKMGVNPEQVFPLIESSQPRTSNNVSSKESSRRQAFSSIDRAAHLLLGDTAMHIDTSRLDSLAVTLGYLRRHGIDADDRILQAMYELSLQVDIFQDIIFNRGDSGLSLVEPLIVTPENRIICINTVADIAKRSGIAAYDVFRYGLGAIHGKIANISKLKAWGNALVRIHIKIHELYGDTGMSHSLFAQYFPRIKDLVNTHQDLDAIADLLEHGFWPDRYLLETYLKTTNKKDLLKSWNNMIAGFKDKGGYENSDPIHRALGYAMILKDASTLPLVRKQLNYPLYSQLAQPAMNAAFKPREWVKDSSDDIELNYLTYEALKLLRFIEQVRAKAENSGRPLVVVENITYGGIALLPIRKELEKMGIRVIGARVSSRVMHRHPLAFDPMLFKDKDLEYLVNKQPVVIIADGTTSVDDTYRTSTHYPDAYQGYRNYFTALNSILGHPSDFKAVGLTFSEIARLKASTLFELFKNKVDKVKRAHAKTTAGYNDFAFWTSSEQKLSIRKKQVPIPDYEPRRFDPEELHGPAIVFAQTAMEHEAVFNAAQKGDREAAKVLRMSYGRWHVPAYFDDQLDHYLDQWPHWWRLFRLNITDKGPKLNNILIDLADKRYKKLADPAAADPLPKLIQGTKLPRNYAHSPDQIIQWLDRSDHNWYWRLIRNHKKAREEFKKRLGSLRSVTTEVNTLLNELSKRGIIKPKHESSPPILVKGSYLWGPNDVNSIQDLDIIVPAHMETVTELDNTRYNPIVFDRRLSQENPDGSKTIAKLSIRIISRREYERAIEGWDWLDLRQRENELSARALTDYGNAVLIAGKDPFANIEVPPKAMIFLADLLLMQAKGWFRFWQHSLKSFKRVLEAMAVTNEYYNLHLPGAKANLKLYNNQLPEYFQRYIQSRAPPISEPKRVKNLQNANRSRVWDEWDAHKRYRNIRPQTPPLLSKIKLHVLRLLLGLLTFANFTSHPRLLSVKQASNLTAMLSSNEKRLIILDYDDTIARWNKKPLRSMVPTFNELINNPQNQVVIVTRRDISTLNSLFLKRLSALDKLVVSADNGGNLYKFSKNHEATLLNSSGNWDQAEIETITEAIRETATKHAIPMEKLRIHTDPKNARVWFIDHPLEITAKRRRFAKTLDRLMREAGIQANMRLRISKDPNNRFPVHLHISLSDKGTAVKNVLEWLEQEKKAVYKQSQIINIGDTFEDGYAVEGLIARLLPWAWHLTVRNEIGVNTAPSVFVWPLFGPEGTKQILDPLGKISGKNNKTDPNVSKDADAEIGPSEKLDSVYDPEQDGLPILDLDKKFSFVLIPIAVFLASLFTPGISEAAQQTANAAETTINIAATAIPLVLPALGYGIYKFSGIKEFFAANKYINWHRLTSVIAASSLILFAGYRLLTSVWRKAAYITLVNAEDYALTLMDKVNVGWLNDFIAIPTFGAVAYLSSIAMLCCCINESDNGDLAPNILRFVKRGAFVMIAIPSAMSIVGELLSMTTPRLGTFDPLDLLAYGLSASLTYLAFRFIWWPKSEQNLSGKNATKKSDDGPAFRLSGLELNREEHKKVINKFIRQAFRDGWAREIKPPAQNEALSKKRGTSPRATKKENAEYAFFDPEGIYEANGTKVFVIETLEEEIEEMAGMAGIRGPPPTDIVVHAGRGKNQVYYFSHQKRFLKSLSRTERAQIADHEVEHIFNPELSEEEIQKIAPLPNTYKPTASALLKASRPEFISIAKKIRRSQRPTLGRVKAIWKGLAGYIVGNAKTSPMARTPKLARVRNSTLWYEDSQEVLKERMPTLWGILRNPVKLSRLLLALSFLRLVYPFDLANESTLAPIAWAKKTGIEFKLNELTIVPVSESFRRHIIYVEDEQGRFAIELKLPGEHSDRNVIQKAHFTVGKDIYDNFPNDPLSVKPLYFSKFTGLLKVYGKRIWFNREEPLGIMLFDYRDGKREWNADDFKERIAEEKGVSYDDIDDKASVDMAVAAIRLHRLGWQGEDDYNTDMHGENIRIHEDGSAELAGDYGAFEKTYPDMEQRAEETTRLLGYQDDPSLVAIFPKIVKRLVARIRSSKKIAAVKDEVRQELDLPESVVTKKDRALAALALEEAQNKKRFELTTKGEERLINMMLQNVKRIPKGKRFFSILSSGKSDIEIAICPRGQGLRGFSAWFDDDNPRSIYLNKKALERTVNELLDAGYSGKKALEFTNLLWLPVLAHETQHKIHFEELKKLTGLDSPPYVIEDEVNAFAAEYPILVHAMKDMPENALNTRIGRKNREILKNWESGPAGFREYVVSRLNRFDSEAPPSVNNTSSKSRMKQIKEAKAELSEIEKELKRLNRQVEKGSRSKKLLKEINEWIETEKYWQDQVRFLRSPQLIKKVRNYYNKAFKKFENSRIYRGARSQLKASSQGPAFRTSGLELSKEEHERVINKMIAWAFKNGKARLVSLSPPPNLPLQGGGEIGERLSGQRGGKNNKEYSFYDPSGDYIENGTKVYELDVTERDIKEIAMEAGIRAPPLSSISLSLQGRGQGERDTAPTDIVVHAGRDRNQVYYFKHQAPLLKKLYPQDRSQVAKHEVAHINNPTLSEKEVQAIAPLPLISTKIATKKVSKSRWVMQKNDEVVGGSAGLFLAAPLLFLSINKAAAYISGVYGESLGLINSQFWPSLGLLLFSALSVIAGYKAFVIHDIGHYAFAKAAGCLVPDTFRKYMKPGQDPPLHPQNRKQHFWGLLGGPAGNIIAGLMLFPAAVFFSSVNLATFDLIHNGFSAGMFLMSIAGSLGNLAMGVGALLPIREGRGGYKIWTLWKDMREEILYPPHPASPSRGEEKSKG
ncbi:hypothetical protein ACFL6Y_07855 [Elusimicrobiota bacterium]